MVKRAEFEEKEYEAPLYNQLEPDSNLLWSPGQVFEYHLGIDRALWVTNPHFWHLIGKQMPLPGVFLNRYNWNYIWLRRGRQRPLPNFRLNLFIQAKRPFVHKSVPKNLRNQPLTTPLWHFDIVEHQQLALERVAGNLGNHACICYAAPAFDRVTQLYGHTKRGTIVENSTFPEVVVLRGHKSWWYCRPGGSGVSNKEPVFVEGDDIYTRIKRFIKIGFDKEESNAVSNLEFLAKSIYITIIKETEESDPRSVIFSDMIRSLNKEFEIYNMLDESLWNFMCILIFLKIYLVEWFVIG